MKMFEHRFEDRGLAGLFGIYRYSDKPERTVEIKLTSLTDGWSEKTVQKAKERLAE